MTALCEPMVHSNEASLGTSSPPYLTFSSANPFSIHPNRMNWDGTLEYSVNGTDWNEWWDGSEIDAGIQGSDYKIYLRGTGNSYISYDNSGRFILTGTDVACTGNIENLLDYATVAAGNHPTMAEACFSYLFNECTALTAAPALPATNLTDSCYYEMFSNSGIAISETEDDEYTLPWSIPASATSANNWNGDIFSGTAGSFTGDPEIGHVYYQRTHAAKPVITPASGEYTNSVMVSISAVTGASIYYTTDGSDPSTNSTPYMAAFTLSTGGTNTVKAIAVKDRLENSAVASATYTIIPLEPVLNATIKWRLNRGTGTYFAQLCVTCTAGGFDEISDLRFVFADRTQGSTAYAQLWNSPNRAALAQTMALEGGEMGRYVVLDATRITAPNTPVVYGLSDATLDATTSVPTTERLIELYVRKRVSPVSGNETDAEVENFVGYLSWVWNGERYWTAVAEGPALMMATQMQTVTRAPLSLAKLNLSAGLQKAATPDLLAECAITDFTVEGGIVSGRYEVTALQNATQSRVENLGANATVVVYGTASLGGEFKEIGTATVNLNQGAFTVPIETSDCTFFKVVLRIANVVE